MGIAKRKRAGRHASLKRIKKNRVTPPIFKHPIVEKELRPHFDKILRSNPSSKYHAIGLTMDVNEAPPDDAAPLLMSDPPPERKRGAGMSLNEARYLQKLQTKHGSDIGAMARDHKLNYDQKSAGQLRKRLAVYLDVYAADARSEPIAPFVAQPRGRLPFRYVDPRAVERRAMRDESGANNNNDNNDNEQQQQQQPHKRRQRRPARAPRHTEDVVSKPGATRSRAHRTVAVPAIAE